jgi:hypothetical protein
MKQVLLMIAVVALVGGMWDDLKGNPYIKFMGFCPERPE